MKLNIPLDFYGDETKARINIDYGILWVHAMGWAHHLLSVREDEIDTTAVRLHMAEHRIPIPFDDKFDPNSKNTPNEVAYRNEIGNPAISEFYKLQVKRMASRIVECFKFGMTGESQIRQTALGASNFLSFKNSDGPEQHINTMLRFDDIAEVSRRLVDYDNNSKKHMGETARTTNNQKRLVNSRISPPSIRFSLIEELRMTIRQKLYEILEKKKIKNQGSSKTEMNNIALKEADVDLVELHQKTLDAILHYLLTMAYPERDINEYAKILQTALLIFGPNEHIYRIKGNVTDYGEHYKKFMCAHKGTREELDLLIKKHERISPLAASRVNPLLGYPYLGKSEICSSRETVRGLLFSKMATEQMVKTAEWYYNNRQESQYVA